MTKTGGVCKLEDLADAEEMKKEEKDVLAEEPQRRKRVN